MSRSRDGVSPWPLVFTTGFSPREAIMRTTSTISGCTSGSPPATDTASVWRNLSKTSRSERTCASDLWLPLAFAE